MSAVSSSSSPDVPVDDTHVDDRLDPEPLSQRGGQQQPGVGDRVVVSKPTTRERDRGRTTPRKCPPDRLDDV
jgi:hypothetical protein